MKQIEKIKQLKKIEWEESCKKRKPEVNTQTSKPSARNKKSVVKSAASSDIWTCSTRAVHLWG